MTIKNFDIASHVTECDLSYRGGKLKVDVSEVFPKVENAIMGAYQNYLGGGIAGRIVGAAMFDPSTLSRADQVKFDSLKARIVQYFYDCNNGGGDEYMQEEVNNLSFNQGLPVSAY